MGEQKEEDFESRDVPYRQLADVYNVTLLAAAISKTCSFVAQTLQCAIHIVCFSDENRSLLIPTKGKIYLYHVKLPSVSEFTIKRSYQGLAH